MIIHVTGAVKQFQKPAPFIATIKHVTEQNDCVLAYDQPKGNASLEAEIAAMSHADIVVVEASEYGLDQGMQVAIALQQKKPTLVVSQASLEHTALARYRNRLLVLETYANQDELAKLLTRFIHTNTISTKDLRFNMFIDRPIYNYLRTQAYETGKNKSEIIRDLINQEINKND
ncbi:MAG TPA: hypothetical protein VJ843_03415 [Candidatus Saccharimonadales bacterium]|nr:hypothetical protein [Candidatus Saccharimonadales bacterium]